MDWLMWAPLGAVSIHIFEEFVFPGGFAGWYRKYRADPSRITPRFLILINAVLLVVCCDAGTLGRTPLGAAYWLGLATLLCTNGLWHLWASCKRHTYSPGVITGVGIYLPLAVYGYVVFLRSGVVSAATALLAGLVGGSFQIWDAAYHRRRAAKS